MTSSVAAQGSKEPVSLNLEDLSGNGTETNPYEISNASELQAMGTDKGTHYELVTDVNASNTAQWNNGKGFYPIGFSGLGSEFEGRFDGNNHTINHLTINRSGSTDIGLFGVTDYPAQIKYLTISNITVKGHSDVGGLVGETNGIYSDVSFSTITNVNISGNISGSGSDNELIGTTDVGGLVGYHEGQIKNSRASGFVNASNQVGGLVGANNGEILNSRASVNVSASGEFTNAGGLIGLNRKYGIIQNVRASGSVNGKENVGGIAGKNLENELGEQGGIIRNATATGSVNGTDGVGGLVGVNEVDAVIQNASATGSVHGSNKVGGLIGINSDIIQNVSATGSVHGSSKVGGLVGENDYDATIQNTAATGSVSGLDKVGGLTGINTNKAIIQKTTANGSVDGSKEVGGLVGDNRGSIQNSSALGSVNGSREVGGLVGDNSGQIQSTFAVGYVSGTSFVGGSFGGNYGMVEKSYWDTQTTKQQGNSGNATGLTTAQMTGTAAKKYMTGLQFGTIWQIQQDGYPVIKQQPLKLNYSNSGENSSADGDSVRFNITGLRYSEEVNTGERISLTATIRNEGDQTRTNTVTFALGDAKSTTRLTLDSGEQNRITTTFIAPKSGSTINFSVSTNGESVARTIQLSEPNSTRVKIRNVNIEPMTISTDSSQLHTLSFTTHNVSSDGQQDEFTISLPQTVSVESIQSVTTNRTDELAYDTNNNDIEFNVNPNDSKSSINYRISIRIRISAAVN